MKGEQLFEQALELPVDERISFLRTTCGEDRSLCEKLKRLLAQHRRHSTVLDSRCMGAEDLLTIIATATAADAETDTT